MELFDKKFVYFMWDDNLRGKECFYDDEIDGLRNTVNANDIDFKSCLEPNTPAYPFRVISKGRNCSWRFAYYDPNYIYKVAYSKGSRIQHRAKGTQTWFDGTPGWDSRYEYRIKPVTYYIGIGANKTLTWDFTATSYKHVYASFDSMTAAKDWIVAHKKFVPVMRAFEKGLIIEYKVRCGDWTRASTPSWDLRLRYRVTPLHSNVTPHCSDCNNLTKSFTSEPCNKGFDASKREPKKRRMTNRELAKWLAEGRGQARMAGNVIITDYRYDDKDEGSVGDCMIRGWNEAKWHEPDVAMPKQEAK